MSNGQTETYKNFGLYSLCMAFKRDFEALKNVLDTAVKNEINLDNKIDTNKAMLNYSLNQRKYHQDRLSNALKAVKDSSFELGTMKQPDEISQEKLTKIMELIPSLETTDVSEINKTVKKIDFLIKQIKFPSMDDKFVKIPKRIPNDIRQDIVLDLEELERCYQNECYRSCVILCGRLLETALHRKFYDVTGQDALEKSPGIGLGNLIAKLAEKNVILDPGLTNQIHLINQVRVFSVHKKKDAFYPTQQQTQAMILYTLDILNKLF